jgi:CubicO group peptidase (beta-lactamase class C family)
VSEADVDGIEGLVTPGWEPVAEAFARNFEFGEVGAACCIHLDGAPVVELVGGRAHAPVSDAWRSDTLALVFSTTKGATAACANLLIARGALDPDVPVAEYWPEFAANGKDTVLVRHVLSHSAGLPVVDGDFTLDEVLAWAPVVEQLARQAPRWEPGTAVGYHMRTYGWLVGELVRRITDTTLGAFFRTELGDPLGLDWWIGLPEAEEPRVAPILPPAPATDPEVQALMAAVMAPGTMLGDALTGPAGHFHYDEMWNTRALHECELPSSNGIASAFAVSRLYAALVTAVAGAPVFDDATIARATATQIEGTDVVIGAPMRYGLGFSLGDALSSAARPTAFGHSGAGGSLGFADPAHGVGFGYVMNRMQVGLAEDKRPRNLVRAMYRVLDGT